MTIKKINQIIIYTPLLFALISFIFVYYVLFEYNVKYDDIMVIISSYLYGIPSIKKPVDFLNSNMMMDRAIKVQLSYAFCWLFMILSALFALIIYYINSKLYSEKDSFYKDQHISSDNRSGFYLIGIIIIVAYLQIWYDSYDFKGYSVFRNMVHIRDIDFFRPVLFMTIFLYLLLSLISLAFKKV